MRGWLALVGPPRGYCSRAEICTRECSENDPCPDNSTCSRQGGGALPPLLPQRVQGRPVCLHTCETTSDCLPNFSCSGSVCVLTSPLDPPPAT